MAMSDKKILGEMKKGKKLIKTKRGGLPSNGIIEVFCGSMYSGKSRELIRIIDVVKIARQNVIVFKPEIDNRSGNRDVVSHNKDKVSSVVVKTAKEIIKKSSKYDVIGIDEAQFFDNEIIDVVNELANSGRRIIITGLDMDYRGKPFGPIPNLMAIADSVQKLKAVCSVCTRPAQFSFRIDSSNKQVLIGAYGKYQALCRSCFTERQKNF